MLVEGLSFFGKLFSESLRLKSKKFSKFVVLIFVVQFCFYRTVFSKELI